MGYEWLGQYGQIIQSDQLQYKSFGTTFQKLIEKKTKYRRNC
jgi:hypothetical protein